MKFELPNCPKCGDIPECSEQVTMNSQYVEPDEDGGYEWGSLRDTSCEGEESPCVAEAKDKVYGAACDMVDAADPSVVQACFDKVVAAVKEARNHDDHCITLCCSYCREWWHTRVKEEEP